MLEPLLAGVGIALVAGLMGCFVVWRRMAYFGDSLAHSSLLGVALGVAFGIGVNFSTVIVCSLFAILLLYLQQKKLLAIDTLMGILAHSALSIGLVTIAILGQDIELHDYLLGDIMSITSSQLYWIYGGAVIILSLLLYNWSALVLMTIHEDLARAENINTLKLQTLFMFLMTIVVAISIHIMGILLITSLLIIPAASARQIAKTPTSMAIIAVILAVVSVIAGIFSAIEFATPSGPTIVVAATCLFIILFIISSIFKVND